MNSSNVFTINAEANPAITKFSWTKKGGREIQIKPGPGQRLSATGPNLYINNIKREDGGVFTVTAVNTIGISKTSFRVNVEYPPR